MCVCFLPRPGYSHRHRHTQTGTDRHTHHTDTLEQETLAPALFLPRAHPVPEQNKARAAFLFRSVRLGAHRPSSYRVELGRWGSIWDSVVAVEWPFRCDRCDRLDGCQFIRREMCWETRRDETMLLSPTVLVSGAGHWCWSVVLRRCSRSPVNAIGPMEAYLQ